MPEASESEYFRQQREARELAEQRLSMGHDPGNAYSDLSAEYERRNKRPSASMPMGETATPYRSQSRASSVAEPAAGPATANDWFKFFGMLGTGAGAYGAFLITSDPGFDHSIPVLLVYFIMGIVGAAVGGGIGKFVYTIRYLILLVLVAAIAMYLYGVPS